MLNRYSALLKMKKTSIIFLIYLLSCQTYGQHVSISLEKFKVLYSHFDNPIDIAVTNYSCNDIIAKVKYSKIKKIDSADTQLTLQARAQRLC